MREWSRASAARWRFREGARTHGRTARLLECCRIPMEQNLSATSEKLTVTLLDMLHGKYEWQSDAHRLASFGAYDSERGGEQGSRCRIAYCRCYIHNCSSISAQI